MKTAIIIAIIFVFVIFGVPRFFRGAIKRREARRTRIADAIKLIGEAGLTAHNEREDAVALLKLETAVSDLKKAGYKITPR